MRVLLSTLLLALTWFAVVNVVMSAATWVVTRRVLGRGSVDAGVLFILRMLPAFASGLFVVAVFLPSHVRFEQADAEESFGVVLAACAVLAVAMLLRSAARAVRVIRADYEFGRLAARVPQQFGRDVFTIDGVPGVSLAGILRSRILVGRETLAALTSAELAVAISHEAAHESSRDNLKRLLMYCAPDVFGWSETARLLEDAWQSAAEYRADDYAVLGDESRAVVLASALVKVAQVARRARGVANPVAAWSAFHVPSLLETRVRRLVTGPIAMPQDERTAWRAAIGVTLAVPAGMWMPGLSYALHTVTEAMVTYLP